MAATLVAEVKDELKQVAEESIVDFEKTTSTWAHKPDFKVEETDEGVMVTTDDEPWNWTDKGTPPHVITARNAPALVFRSPFRAKTKAHTIASYQGFVGNQVNVLKEVHHPGTEAREFSETIAERWQPKVTKRVRDRLKAGIEAPGL